MSASVQTIIVTCSTGVASGVFNFILAKTGYIAPVYDEAAKLTVGFVQPAATQNAIIFCFVGLEIVTAIVACVPLSRFQAEKNILKEQAEIKARREEN